jgi:16S rRNA (guanine966-N2)-methyltransferase
MEAAYAQVLTTLSNSAFLLPETIVIVEHQKRFDPGERIACLQRYRLLKQGDAALSFYRRR